MGEKHITLIDILVVIAIIALISAILLPPIKPAPISPHVKTLRKLSQIEKIIHNYRSTNQKWPDESIWNSQLQEELRKQPFRDPNNLLIDSWSNPIQYKIFHQQNSNTILLYSFGPNGIDNQGNNDDLKRYFYEELNK